MIWVRTSGDEMCDPEHQLRLNDYTETGITIQDCRAYGGGFGLNRHGYEVEGDPDSFYVEHLAQYRTLQAAKAAAETLWRTR